MATVRPHASLGLSLCALILLLSCPAPGIAAEEETVHLSFDLPEGKVLHYKSSMMQEMVAQGMEVTNSHSMMVEMSLLEIMEDGTSKVALSFSNEDASLFRDGEMEDYEPDIKLEGKTAYAFVNAKNEVLRAEAASYIPGLSGDEELREMIEDWFVRLPDADIVPGTEWRTKIERMGMSREGEDPEIKGYTDFKLKKIKEKNGMMIAEIEGKTRIDINKAMYNGVLVAKGEGEIKAKIALDGGYIIECERKMDVKGKTKGRDPLTGKESESETAITQYFECELKE